MRRRILVITTDPLTERMPGPAIRAWNLAATLSRENDVTLISSVACSRAHPGLAVRHATTSEVTLLAASSEVVIGPGSVVRRYPELAASPVPLAIDLYDPYHLENLEADGSTDINARAQNVHHLTTVVNEDLRRGDFFLCASERQRDFWLGSLAAVGRVNPYTYDGDPRLERLIAVVPFGLPSHPPSHSGGPGLHGRFPTIRPTDPIAIWGGGVYSWFDPLSLVRAVALASSTVPNLRLVFLGMTNPNPEIPEMAIAKETRRLATDLGLTGTHIFFNDGWVPYDERADYLLEGNIGVSTSYDHIESRFSFRTRVLDYLWAGLPVLLTAGDTLSALVTDAGAGSAVPAADVTAIAAAIEHLLSAPPSREHIRTFARQFHWDHVAAPLLDFCRQPHRAADLSARPRQTTQAQTGREENPTATPPHLRSTARALRAAQSRLFPHRGTEHSP